MTTTENENNIEHDVRLPRIVKETIELDPCVRLRRHIREVEESNKKYKKALEKIRDEEGKMCKCAFTNCVHRACTSSYMSWTIADYVLKYNL